LMTWVTCGEEYTLRFLIIQFFFSQIVTSHLLDPDVINFFFLPVQVQVKHPCNRTQWIYNWTCFHFHIFDSPFHIYFNYQMKGQTRHASVQYSIWIFHLHHTCKAEQCNISINNSCLYNTAKV
jgi:hypothetical protein